MNELVQLVQEKTGLSQDVAEKVVDTVIGFIKTKVPAPMAAGLDSLLATGQQAGTAAAAAAGTAADKGSGLMSDAKELIGGMFKKDA